MKTKILIPILVLIHLLAVSATAQVNYAVSSGTAHVTYSPTASGDIVIASTFNGFPVNSAGGKAFSGCTNLTSVTIPVGRFSTNVQVVPKQDELVEGLENVILRLAPGPGYDVSGDSNAVGVIRNPPPVFSDANWSSIMGIDSPQIFVDSAVVDGASNLYVGGSFTISGVATNIAKWNGSHWSALGSGMTNVYALAVSGTDLYAAGWFARAGGIPVTNIAKWNGTNWSALGAGVSRIVFALAVSGSNVYAGGYSGIAKWDGSSWSALPGSGINNIVRALAVSGSDLYAAGDASSGVTANCIARWNGSSWSALGSGMNRIVIALAVSGSDLYAGGSFTTAGGSPATNIAKWDGTFWHPLGSGIGGGSSQYVNALAVSGSSLHVGGQFRTAGGKASAGIAKARIASTAEFITASGSSATIQFSGVVGYQYHVQRTDRLTPPMTWTTLTASPLSPAADGSFSFIDTNAAPGPAYYRLVQH